MQVFWLWINGLMHIHSDYCINDTEHQRKEAHCAVTIGVCMSEASNVAKYNVGFFAWLKYDYYVSIANLQSLSSL